LTVALSYIRVRILGVEMNLKKYGYIILTVVIITLCAIIKYKSNRLNKMLKDLMKKRHKEELRELKEKKAKLKETVNDLDAKRRKAHSKLNSALRKLGRKSK
jgi:cell division protein FtsB